jgi:UPF0716 protein FxsA
MQMAAGPPQRRRPMRWIAIWFGAEILLFVVLSEWFGFGPVLLAQIASSLIGAALFRQLGRGPVNNRTQSSKQSEPAVADVVSSSLAALLFILPGFLSTLAAVLLSIPLVRARFHLRVERWFRQTFPQAPGFGGGAVDLDATEWRAEPRAPQSKTSLPPPNRSPEAP